MGVRFNADSAYCLDDCERLDLPLAAMRSQANNRAAREHAGVLSNNPPHQKTLEATVSTFFFAEETEPERVPVGSTADLPNVSLRRFSPSL